MTFFKYDSNGKLELSGESFDIFIILYGFPEHDTAYHIFFAQPCRAGVGPVAVQN